MSPGIIDVVREKYYIFEEKKNFVDIFKRDPKYPKMQLKHGFSVLVLLETIN